jgi:hypothetical protein
MKIVHVKRIGKDSEEIYAFKRSSKDYGFVFNPEGTKIALEFISQDSPLMIYDGLSDYFLFENDDAKLLWAKFSKKTKKELISSNINRMIKKMSVNYREFGDRCHYFSVGKIEIVEKTKNKDKDNIYPLFVFPCDDIDEKRQSAKINRYGFLNFVVDENKLHNGIMKILNDRQIDAKRIFINREFVSSLCKIETDINNLNIRQFGDIKCDCKMSFLSIITGFKAEYLDPAWDKILGECK